MMIVVHQPRPRTILGLGPIFSPFGATWPCADEPMSSDMRAQRVLRYTTHIIHSGVVYCMIHRFCIVSPGIEASPRCAKISSANLNSTPTGNTPFVDNVCGTPGPSVDGTAARYELCTDSPLSSNSSSSFPSSCNAWRSSAPPSERPRRIMFGNVE